MDTGKAIYISDSIHGSVRINYFEKQVISTQIFNRLHSISQNSTVYLTFPTNRTKRFEHSIGTMSLCGRMFQSSITNTDKETLNDFFNNMECIIDKEIEEILSIKKDKYRTRVGDRNLSPVKLKEYKTMEISREYDSFIPANVEENYKNIYAILFQSIRLAALLHDVGHPPFSHIAESSLKNVWGKIIKIQEEDRNSRQKRFISCMEKYFETGQDLHEQIGNKITEELLDDIIESIDSDKAKDQEIFEEQLFKVLVSDITSAILQEKNKSFGELHRIIDGTLDGDRLDYVSRDPINSGLNVGIIQYERIIGSMRLVKIEEVEDEKIEANFIFCASSKVIDSIEDFFNRRWKLYKQIIYHHRVIKTDYLLQKCIEALAIDYLNEEIEEIEDDINILPYDISGLWKAIEEKPSHNDYFNLLIQWDDSWLMTILKKHYFDKYINEKNNNISYQLEELLANKKYYFSVIKRMEDFIEIDRAATKVVQEGYGEINSIIEELRKESNTSEKNIIELEYLLDTIIKLGNNIHYQADKSYVPADGFKLHKIKKVYDNLFYDEWFNDIIYKSVNELKDSNSDIIDAIPVIKKIKTGIQGGKSYTQGGLGVYSKKNGKLNVINFCDLSNESNVLSRDIEYMPVFYLYILKGNKTLDYDDIKKSLGEKIGTYILLEVKNKLNSLKSS